MAKITNLAGMKTYVLQELGSPVITVEIADVQLEQIIEDSVQLYQKYHTGEGNFQAVLAIYLSAGTSAYNVSGQNIMGVSESMPYNTQNGINTMFTSTHSILWQDWVLYGNYPGGNSNISQGQGMALAGYEVAMQYLEDVNEMFGDLFWAEYNVARETIQFFPTPNTNGWCLLTVHLKNDPEKLYNDDIVKRLCVAKAMILWGRQLRKYTMTLPSGATINGAEILQDGKEELEKLMEQMVAESEWPQIYIE